MALTIGPVVHEAERRVALVGHAVGLCLGAATVAMILTLLASPVQSLTAAAPEWIAPAVAAVLLGWAMKSALGVGLPYPRRRWQVPQQWRYTMAPAATLTAYGYLLGLGFLTNVVVPTYWLLVGASLWVGDFGVILIAWTIYAGIRAATTSRIASIVTRNGVDETRAYVPGHQLVANLVAGAVLAATAVVIVA